MNINFNFIKYFKLKNINSKWKWWKIIAIMIKYGTLVIIEQVQRKASPCLKVALSTNMEGSGGPGKHWRSVCSVCRRASSLSTRENIRLEYSSVAEGFSSVRSCVPAVVPRYKRERIEIEKKKK